MNDEKKPPFPAPEGDPEEVKAVQDIFNAPQEETGGDDVFSQDIFSAPPPPPAPSPEPPSAPPPPESAPQKATEEQDVKVVGFDDFDKLAQPGGLSVDGQSYAPGEAPPPTQQELQEEDEGMPELAEPAGHPRPSVEPARAVSDFEEAEAVTENEWAEEDIGTAEPVEETEPAQAVVDEELPLQTEEQPLTFKAAKAKEGPEAVKQTQQLIDHLDGADEGFLDAAEIERAVKSVSELKEELRKLAERVKALEEKMK